ncbi:MAG TPA: AMP-binding protein [Verrucomicrobiae bacterium]|nr:AMP-binding protein [Verrucomicrobiae bacterium]
MTFLEAIFDRLQTSGTAPVLREIRGSEMVSATGGELLGMVQQARVYLRARGLQKGDRCALLAPNSIRWAALDLAIMAEGLIALPLYARQAPAELVEMMQDSLPARICCPDAVLAAEINRLWPGAPKISLPDTIFSGDAAPPEPPVRHADSDAVAIIYTSGTSGEAKGVLLNAGNVNHMLRCTAGRLDQLMGARTDPDSVFHYLPFCFAGSWILLLSALSRNSVLTLSTDLTKLADELKLAAPHYFLNVPTLLERVRTRIEQTIRERGGMAARIFFRGQDTVIQRHWNGTAGAADSLYLAMAKLAIFPTIRKSLGPNLKALICGSAPLAVETQLFFQMLGIPVLQVYGLTETTAICTMDDPARNVPGRVGPAIPGIEMQVSDAGEILVRGPNIFPGYWKRPEATAKALEGGWFHTGDQGEADASGNWKITGRLKNLIILNSGHNVAPEPIEESLAAKLPEVEHAVLIGNQRGYLAALLATAASDGLPDARIQAAIDSVNDGLPHYKRVRAFWRVPEAFTIESGLLTANGKLKRDAIAARYAAEIEKLYEKKTA